MPTHIVGHSEDLTRFADWYHWKTCSKPTFKRVAVLPLLMSLLSDVGRKFEKAKQTVTDSKQAKYVCESCETSVDKNYEYCPHCGEETVTPIE